MTTSRPIASSLERFQAEATRLPRLERDEEHALAVRAVGGDRGARDQLVAANARHVIAIASRYRRYGIPVADLVAEGNVGLCIAATKFEPERGTRFVTYAGHWVRAKIIDAILRDRSLVGGGAGVFRSKVYFRLHRERARLEAVCPDRGERTRRLAEQFGQPEARIDEMLARLDARDVSLDAPLTDEGSESHLDRLADRGPPADELLHEHAMHLDLGERLAIALAELDPRERRIVSTRALADDEELSLAELARELGVSRERARQLEVRAHGKLRKRLAGAADAA